MKKIPHYIFYTSMILLMIMISAQMFWIYQAYGHQQSSRESTLTAKKDELDRWVKYSYQDQKNLIDKLVYWHQQVSVTEWSYLSLSKVAYLFPQIESLRYLEINEEGMPFWAVYIDNVDNWGRSHGYAYYYYYNDELEKNVIEAGKMTGYFDYNYLDRAVPEEYNAIAFKARYADFHESTAVKRLMTPTEIDILIMEGSPERIQVATSLLESAKGYSSILILETKPEFILGVFEQFSEQGTESFIKVGQQVAGLDKLSKTELLSKLENHDDSQLSARTINNQGYFLYTYALADGVSIGFFIKEASLFGGAQVEKTLLINQVFILFLTVFLAMVMLIRHRTFKRHIQFIEEALVKISKFEFSDIRSKKTPLTEFANTYQAIDLIKVKVPKIAKYLPQSLEGAAFNRVVDLPAERKEVCTLFIDLAGFSKFCENKSNHVVTQTLNAFYSHAIHAVRDNNGIIDKFIGDSVMALWIDQSDDKLALNACKAAFSIHDRWLADSTLQMENLHIRIGIDSGICDIGNFGNEFRTEYTVCGGSVNIASRLEQLNKQYRTMIMVSENIVRQLDGQLNTRFVDEVYASNMNKRIKVFEVLQPGHPLEEGDRLFQYTKNFQLAFVKYQLGKWEEALAGFEELQAQFPDDTLCEVFISRIRKLQEKGIDDWTGVWRF